MIARVSPAIALIAVGCVAATTGCSSTRSNLRDAKFKDVATAGQVVQPKRCLLTFALITRPAKDHVLNQSIWSVADEQVIPMETKMTLEANGLRVGIVSGDLPADVDALLSATGVNKVDPYQVETPDGGLTPVVLTQPVPMANLFFNNHGQILGRSYEDAQGFVNVTASQEGNSGLTLRITPGVHHGPVKQDWTAAPTLSPNTSQELVQKNGQKEEAFRDLALTVNLLPNQTLVIGCGLERPKSLGTFLMTEHELNSDRLKQRVLLVRGVRSNGPEPMLANASESQETARQSESPRSKLGSSSSIKGFKR